MDMKTKQKPKWDWKSMLVSGHARASSRHEEPYLCQHEHLRNYGFAMVI